ncbi:MAG: outer membrane lipoprotein carrier protein LolA [Saprospiraceae bacterium]
MKQFLFCLIASLITSISFAQTSTFTDGSDPAAKAILEKIKNEYQSYSSMEIDFTLTIAFPEEKEEIQKGSITQQGNKYRMQMGAQEIISDGEVLWLYLKDRNEVQINDIEEAGDGEVDIFSPEDLFTLYEKGDYIYALVNEEKEGGKAIQQIEFKPTDRYSEYTKLRLTIEKGSNKVMRMKVFSKDGSKYTLNIDKLNANKKFDADYFTFKKENYPGVKVENLRM